MAPISVAIDGVVNLSKKDDNAKNSKEVKQEAIPEYINFLSKYAINKCIYIYAEIIKSTKYLQIKIETNLIVISYLVMTFYQATNMFIDGQGPDGFRPATDTNMIELTGGWGRIPMTIWLFDDPVAPDMCYFAKFPPGNVPQKEGELVVVFKGGELIRSSRIESIPALPVPSDLEVSLLLAGANSKANGISAILGKKS